ncbi:putative bardet-Biedl syndrome 2 protein [Plasmopara halstedii]
MWHYCRKSVYPSPNENTFQNNSLVGDNEQSSMRFLKINRTVTALAAGKFETTDQGDTLVIGTQSSLLAYDVEKIPISSTRTCLMA